MIIQRKVRQGQLISTFGIGQIINFPDNESLMVCGLHLWDEAFRYMADSIGQDDVSESELRIDEPRLAKLLGVKYFKYPFPYKKRGQNRKLSIPAVRFPGWYYCPYHHTMRRIGLLQKDHPICSVDGCNNKLVPVRFMAACEAGHAQDVPFMEWVHNGPVPDDGTHVLSYRGGRGSGDLGSIRIECSCKKSRSLGSIMFANALKKYGKCKGHRPWLGREGLEPKEPCQHDLRVLLIGSSNVFYAKVRSALKLPTLNDETPKIINEILDKYELIKLKTIYDQGVLPIVLDGFAEIKSGRYTVEEIEEHLLKMINNTEPEQENETTELTIRLAEYKHLINGKQGENDDFKSKVRHFSTTSEEGLVSKYFDTVGLVEKLQETRAFAGFSRINSEADSNIRELSLNYKIDWLPAHIVYGEGIFLKFRDDLIQEWSTLSLGNSHQLIEKYHAAQKARWDGYTPREITPAFILIHTFSHLLINRLIYNCGYGSSSLRERIYFHPTDETMNGLLIYTSSGDSEGSMGGLVRQGKSAFLNSLIKEVLEEARWCSADPVCMDIGKKEGQGPDSLNGAACHNCAIVPETSCEEFNILLDRNLLIDPKFGFFREAHKYY